MCNLPRAERSIFEPPACADLSVKSARSVREITKLQMFYEDDERLKIDRYSTVYSP